MIPSMIKVRLSHLCCPRRCGALFLLIILAAASRAAIYPFSSSLPPSWKGGGLALIFLFVAELERATDSHSSSSSSPTSNGWRAIAQFRQRRRSRMGGMQVFHSITIAALVWAAFGVVRCLGVFLGNYFSMCYNGSVRRMMMWLPRCYFAIVDGFLWLRVATNLWLMHYWYNILGSHDIWTFSVVLSVVLSLRLS